MPVCEQVGRSFVELQLIDFLFYLYGEQKVNDMLEEANQKAAKASGKCKASVGLIDYGPDCKIFLAEVETMQRRYSGLSQWLVHLLNEKRGTQPLPLPTIPPSDAPGSSTDGQAGAP